MVRAGQRQSENKSDSAKTAIHAGCGKLSGRGRQQVRRNTLPSCRTRRPVMSAGAIDETSEAGVGLAVSSALTFVRCDRLHQGHQLTLHGLVLDLAVGAQQS